MAKDRGNKKGQGNEKPETGKKATPPRRQQSRRRRQPTNTPERTQKKKSRQDKNHNEDKGNKSDHSDTTIQSRKRDEETVEKSPANNFRGRPEEELTTSGENTGKPSTMEDEASLATAAVKNTQNKDDKKEGPWIPVPVRNPYKNDFLAKKLPDPIQHGFKAQWRGNFCIKIEPADTRAETEENVQDAIHKLVTIMVEAKAQLLPWKEKEYEKQHVVNQENLENFVNLPFYEMKKKYINSAFYTAKSRLVYLGMYWGLPRKYPSFRKEVETKLDEIGITWYKQTIQAENRYTLGFIKGSHQKTDLVRLQERIHTATNLNVVARWRLWTLPKNLRPEGITDDKVYAIALETDQRYSAKDRRLIYRMFGSEPDLRQEVELAIGTTIEIQLIPEKINGLNDLAKESAVKQRALQRDINKELREATMYNTILGNINDILHQESGITFRDLIMTTTIPTSNQHLFVSVDQASGQDSPTLTYINGLEDQVQRFIEGARLTMEKNADFYFGISLDLGKKFTGGANSNYDEQEFDDETGQITTQDDKYLMALGQQVQIDWKDYVGNAIDPSKWITEEQMDENSMESRLDDQSYQTQYTNETIFPAEEIVFMNEDKQEELTQYSSADDRENGASAMKT